ncbi:MAG: alkaline phosphatase family protein [Bacteroidia bacterium]
MKRRDFIKKSALATAGVFAAPYLLPGGRLFAASGLRKVNHVVFCLFAGGVRNLESVHMNDGNLMPCMFSGGGSISSDIAGAMDPLPISPLGAPLQTYGTLFKEFRYRFGPTGHYNGHTVAVTGNYVDIDLNLREHPRNPTVFEYYRKHNSPQQTAMNSWWVANTLGPYPALNYSTNSQYGPAYGANFIAPTALISPQGFDVLGNPRTFNSAEEAAIVNMRDFTNGIFNHTYSDGSAGVTNSHADALLLQQFITDLYIKAQTSSFLNQWGVGQQFMNNDMYNILFANEIIKTFKPELLVVNMQDVDVAHFQFTESANNLRKADYAVAQLWNTIQSTPGMANDTVLIIAPEHGRNFYTNSSIDAYGRYATDHTAPTDPDFTGDPNLQVAREIFCLVVGPPNVVVQNQVINTVFGESTDIVPAIANLLGFDDAIPGGMISNWSNCDLQAAFV